MLSKQCVDCSPAYPYVGHDANECEYDVTPLLTPRNSLTSPPGRRRSFQLPQLPFAHVAGIFDGIFTPPSPSPISCKRSRTESFTAECAPPTQRTRQQAENSSSVSASCYGTAAVAVTPAKTPTSSSPSSSAAISVLKSTSSLVTLMSPPRRLVFDGIKRDSPSKSAPIVAELTLLSAQSTNDPSPASTSWASPSLSTRTLVASALPCVQYSPSVQPDTAMFESRVKQSPMRSQRLFPACPPTPSRRTPRAAAINSAVDDALTILKLEQTMAAQYTTKEQETQPQTDAPSSVSPTGTSILSVLTSPETSKNVRADDFEWLEKIGEGSYSEVYKCIRRRTAKDDTDNDDEPVFAIKRSKRPFIGLRDRQNVLKRITLLTHLQSQPQQYNRHRLLAVQDTTPHSPSALPQRELCWHPNLLRHYDIWQESGGHVFVQTELCAGGDLTNFFHADSDKRCEFDVWRLLCEMSNALEYMHARQLLHMDVSLANILVDVTGTFKLADLGSVIRIGQFIDGDEGDGAFLAPEVLSGVVGEACDVYSLGMVAYACITAQTVRRTSAEESAEPAADEQLDFAHSFFTVSAACKLLIDQMTSLQPQQRPTLKQIYAIANQYLSKTSATHSA